MVITAPEAQVALTLRTLGALSTGEVARAFLERACAYLVAADSQVTLASIQQHLDSLGVAKFKWPERLEWVPEMPKTAVGKLDKKALAADIAAKLATERTAGR